MEFKMFKKKLQANFETITKNQAYIFEVELDKDILWNLYLDSFPEGTNEIYRERREYDCSCCRQFIKNIGNVVVIEDNQIKTIWDFDTDSTTFQPVVKTLSEYVKSHPITSIWVSKFKDIGVDKNYEEYEGTTLEWTHLYLELDKKFVDKTARSMGDIQGSFRDSRNVFKRSLDELTEESVSTVLELIYQNSLYKGEEWKSVLEDFSKIQKEYNKLTDAEKEFYTWQKSAQVGSAISKIRNHSIGTLLRNISEDMDLDQAVRKYEVIVAPSNYKRPKAIFTQKMLEDAKKTITDLGYIDSLGRRHATLDDITVNNILFSNKDTAKRIQGGDIFADMSSNISDNAKKFSKVEEVSIEHFVNNVLPATKEVEVFLENKHSNNMVSLIAPKETEAPSMFKWDNAFSWAYTGNITDSDMKEKVKSAGGKVDGDLRFSIQWNDIERDSNDLDAHCKEPNNHEIYYMNKGYLSPNGGMLDVDIIRPTNEVAVENITYDNRRTMRDGTYKFFVYGFSGSNKKGFRAEVEFDGQIYSFDYDKPIRKGQIVDVAYVTLKNGEFTIVEKIPSGLSSRDVWGVKTNQFIPAGVIMNSPNFWDGQQGVGHKHYFFMLKDCKNPESPNGFYNEFLKNELVQHKRVFEALGSKMSVEEVEDQLSGVGFSSTKRADLIVKVKGISERIIKIKF